ncbi:hypothetical protein NQ318_007096, partial [Aromia moschata]
MNNPQNYGLNDFEKQVLWETASTQVNKNRSEQLRTLRLYTGLWGSNRNAQYENMLIAQVLNIHRSNITKTIVHEIVSESLGIRKVCAKLVPKVLTDDQKARR